MKRRIGQTGVEVFALGLGAMPLSITNRPAEEKAIKVIHAALDAGVDFIDTANVYCLDDHDIGHNEKLIAKALKSWPGQKDIFVATKGGLARPGGAWEVAGEPKLLRQACENSLRALNVEQIFLYQLHAPDEHFSLADQISTLARLQEEGKIRHIGISNVDRSEIILAQSIARIETVQNELNLSTRRDLDNGVFDACKQENMTYIAYSPVGGGHSHEELSNNSIITSIAQKYHVSSYQLMLAWALSKGDFILPIPGASRIASILDSVKAVNLKIERSDLKAIDEIKF